MSTQKINRHRYSWHTESKLRVIVNVQMKARESDLESREKRGTKKRGEEKEKDIKIDHLGLHHHQPSRPFSSSYHVGSLQGNHIGAIYVGTG